MTDIDVSKVNTAFYTPSDNEAEELVVQRFTDAQTYSAEAYDTLDGLIESLGTVFAGASMPETDIEFLTQEFTSYSGLDAKRPEPPSDADLTPGTITAPTAPTMATITAPTLTLPDYDELTLPDTTYGFSETTYASDLADEVETALRSWISTGSTGLDTDIEAALWARATARQQTQNERMVSDEEDYFAARGFTLPPGALVAGIREINKEIERANAQLNYEISIEQARLAQTNTHFVFTTALQLEGQYKEYANQVGNRALQAAKDAVNVIVTIFEAKVKERLGQYELAKIETEITAVTIDAQAKANKSNTDVYNAQIEKYKADIQKELGIIESIAKVYGFRVAGYEADAKAESVYLDAQIKEFLARVDQEKARSELSVKEAELTLTSYLAALGLNVETIKSSANIASQIAASALSGISAHASLSDGFTRGISQSYRHSQNLSNSATLTESV